VVINDPHRIIPENHQELIKVAEEYGFVIISASTNLVFRELLFHARQDKKQKLLLIDHTPPLRKECANLKNKAPPLFYPDLTYDMPEKNIIDVNIQQYLISKTGDASWPKDANNRRYARLIYDNLIAVLIAYANLRKADPKRFSDEDFKIIVAYSLLGIPHSAFKQLPVGDLWQLVLKNEKIDELQTFAPEIVNIIKSEIMKTEKPFCWFANEDSNKIIRGFFTSLILSQHTNDWQILLANVDPSIAKFQDISKSTLNKYGPEIIRIDPITADKDILSIESSFTKNALRTVLVDRLGITNYDGYKSILEKEAYSVLFRSLALTLALRDLLMANLTISQSKEIYELISSNKGFFVEQRNSESLQTIANLYKSAYEIVTTKQELKSFLKVLRIGNIQEWTFKLFWEKWNNKEINRLEYNLSYVERNYNYIRDFVVPSSLELPEEIGKSFADISEAIKKTSQQSEIDLCELNDHFQDFIVQHYPNWVKESPEVVLTSQFINRCLRPYWDKEKEKAVVLIFDGMRYDIWSKFLKPLSLNYMDIIEEFKASAILPTETHITRKAISAGTFPDMFDSTSAENKLLEKAVYTRNERSYPIEVVAPDGLGTGETVRYRGNNIEVYIFELCDKFLHRISVKTINNREVPAQPIEVIYEQLRNIFEKEVLSIIRRLPKGAKVFITADHGFKRIHRNALWITKEDLNEEKDCNYLNCRLAVPLEKSNIPKLNQEKIIRFKPETLRLPSHETRVDYHHNSHEKTISDVIFPRSQYAFARPNSRFEPDAWSHGGISLQEMIIPMVALKIRESDAETLNIDLGKNSEFNETQEIVFLIKLQAKGKSLADAIRLDLEAIVNGRNDRTAVGSKVVLLKPWQEQEITFNYKFDSAQVSEEERATGEIIRQLTVTAKYNFGKKQYTKTETKEFKIHINAGRIVRRVGGLGNIIGLSPRR
jgi:hypothetical protein